MITPDTTVGTSPIPDNADRACLEAFFCHVTDKMNAWHGLIEEQVFSAETMEDAHPALLRDLQSYSGEQMAQLFVELLEKHQQVNPILGFFRRRRVTKLAASIARTASELSLVTSIRVADTQGYHRRTLLYTRVSRVLDKADRLPLGFHFTSISRASGIIDFIYLPENLDETVGDILDRSYRNVSRYELQAFQRAFDRFYEHLMDITRVVHP